jgi:hypothetical protein
VTEAGAETQVRKRLTRREFVALPRGLLPESHTRPGHFLEHGPKMEFAHAGSRSRVSANGTALGARSRSRGRRACKHDPPRGLHGTARRAFA